MSREANVAQPGSAECGHLLPQQSAAFGTEDLCFYGQPGHLLCRDFRLCWIMMGYYGDELACWVGQDVTHRSVHTCG